MKKVLGYLLAICLITTFTACSDDDDKDTNELVGTWNLQEIIKNTDNSFQSGSLFLIWETQAGTTINGIDVNTLSGIVEPTGSLVLAQTLRDITFLENGTITATYSDAGVDLENPVAPTWKTASGYATYKIKNQKLYVFPNYEKFKTSGNTEGLDINNIINSLGNLSDIGNLTAGMDILNNGIPVNYTIAADNSAKFYIDKELVMKILPLVKLYAESLDNSTENAQIKAIVKELDSVFAKTTKFEIGLNLVKAK
jgi:hypothetical protein